MYIPLTTCIATSVFAERSSYHRQNIATQAATGTRDTTTISQAARDALASSDKTEDAATAARIQAIKAKDMISRTAEDMDYLLTHDSKLAAIYDKIHRNPNSLTAEEIDYQQKTIGFINTMAYLSDGEKKLYDDLVASGNTEAASGLGQIGFLRATMGHVAGGKDGSSYDPSSLALTADNIANYFMHSFVDTTGTTATQLQALARYLDVHPQATASA